MSEQLSITQRPRLFKDFVGQKKVISEIKRRSKTMTFPQVMLFSGPVGTGKTSLAFLVAMLLNSDNPVRTEDTINHDFYYEPELDTPSSKSVISEKFDNDILFYDGSKLAKEDIVDLERIAWAAPFSSKNKVIIIDEIQELPSSKSFNALLKLIETPRKTTYFIFTTMMLGKLNDALISRSIPYKLNYLSDDDIIDYLQKVLVNTKLIDEVPDSLIVEGVPVIVEYSKGSARKAVGDLERCIYGHLYTEKAIREEFETFDVEQTFSLLYLLLHRNPSFFAKMTKVNPSEFFSGSLNTLIDLIKYQYTGEVDKEWKASYLKKLRDVNANELLPFYSDIVENNFYWKDSYFWIKMFEYFNIGSPLAEIKKPEIRKRAIRG